MDEQAIGYRRAWLVIGLVLVSLGLSTTPAFASASASGAISSVVPTGDGLRVQFQVDGLPSDADLLHESVRVALGDEEVSARVSPGGGQHSPQVARRVMLVLDTSGSMAGAPLEAARSAALAYLEAVPADVAVGLVTFDNRVRVLSSPTADREILVEAVRSLAPRGGTRMYDAIPRALSELGSEGQRRILLLGDGVDKSSTVTLQQASSNLRESKVGLDAVALGTSVDRVALRQLATRGSGRVLSAGDEVEAVAAFAEAARAFSAQLWLQVDVPAGMSGDVTNLEVTVASSTGQTFRATAPVVLAGTDGPGVFGRKFVLWFGLAAVFVGLAGALVLAVRVGDSHARHRRRTHEVLATYTMQRSVAPTSSETSPIGSGVLARTALAMAGTVLGGRNFEARLTAKLDRGAVKFSAREWLVLQAVAALVLSGGLTLLANLVLGLFGAVLAVVVTQAWLSRKARARSSRFDAEMPDALQFVASGLSTGYSLPQALDSVVRDGRPPISEELARALAEARLGVPLEDALETVAVRMDSKDFGWVVMAIRVQRTVGGNLSEVLQTVCQTMRERGALRRQVKALSAEGRMSAVILILLPVALAFYLALMNPDFFSPMYETLLGLMLLAGSTVALGVGALWMRKLVKVEM